MQHNLAIASAAATLSVLAGGLAAQPTLVSQQRSIRAGGVTQNAVGFGLFEDEVEERGDDCGGFCIGTFASASQVSEISSAVFFADSSCSASGGSATDTSAVTNFQFEFEVTVATLLSLSGTVRGSVGGFDPPGFTTGLATVEVADIAAGGSRLGFWSADGFSGVVGIAEDVELTPGLYRIRATASADGSAQISGGARFDIAGTFDASASCPADLTGDGIADLADIQFFIESFVTQQPAGDFNADGVYDLADIQGFIAAFNAGCP
jgi:hypothetical protein